MVISSDGSKLYYVTTMLLKIYDVSQPNSALFLYGKSSKFEGEIAISKDDQKIVVGSKNKFEIFDVSDPKNPSVISSKDVPDQVFSIAFSNDENKLLVGLLNEKLNEFQGYSSKVNLTTFDIRTLASPTLLSSVQLSQDLGQNETNLWFHSNKDYAFLYTNKQFKIMRIADSESITFLSTSSLLSLRDFAGSANNDINAVLLDGKVFIMKFYIDVSFNSEVVFKPNALKVIESSSPIKTAITLSKDEKSLFIAKSMNDFELQFTPYTRVSNVQLDMQKPIDFIEMPNFLLSRRSRWDMIVGDKLIVVKAENFHPEVYSQFGPNLFVFNKTDGNEMISYINKNPVHRHEILAVALSEDEKTLAFIKDLTSEDTNLSLSLVTFNNRKGEDVLTDLKLPYSNCSNGIPSLKFSKNGQILFYANCDFLVYDVSNPVSPRRLKGVSSVFSHACGFTLSSSEKTLYLAGDDKNGTTILYIFNTSDFWNIRLLSHIWLEIPGDISRYSVELSSDEKMLYVGFVWGMLMVDVSLPRRPKGFGASYFMAEDHQATLAKKDSIFYTASSSGVTAFDLSSQYLLYMKKSDFKIGSSYSIILNVLKMNTRFKFDYLTKRHKFLKAYLFDFESIPLSGKPTKALPDWIVFDKERSIITIEPRATSIADNYLISVILSIQIQPASFFGLGFISNEREANDLMRNLIQYGYIDRQGYILEDLDLGQKLWLDPKYDEVEREIRAVLSQNYIEAMNGISVSPSLNLSDTRPFKISSPSQDISVTIELNQTDDKSPYFVDKAYADLKSIVNRGSLLTLKGSLQGVNKALEKIFIDLDQLLFCDGTITVKDGINKPISRLVTNISDYFIVNSEAIRTTEENKLEIWSVNPDHLNVQIHLESKTEGQPRFVKKSLSLTPNFHNNQSSLYLDGSMNDINKVLKEILIDLDSFNTCGGYIMVRDDKNNPPKLKHIETLSNHFLINAEPQYNSNLDLQRQIDSWPFYTGSYSTIDLNSKTFTDKNNLPLEYELKMWDSKKEVPSWLKLRGLSLVANPPEVFPSPSYKLLLVVKNEFKSIEILFDLNIKISFSYGATLVMKYMGSLGSVIGFLFVLPKIYNILAKRYYRYPRSVKLKVGEEITDDKIFPISFIEAEIKQSKIIFKELEKGNIAEDFINPESQILDKEKIIETLKTLDKYSGGKSGKIIQQLVINMVVMKQLSSKEETATKKIFDKMKNKWMDLVTYNSEFMINSASLQQELLKISSMKKNIDLDETNLSAELLSSDEGKINIDLLKNAIIAHAYSFQNLNIRAIRVDVLSYQKIKRNSLLNSIMGFFLYDLAPFVFINKGDIGHGIKCNIKENVLRFSGQLIEELKDDAVIIHIKDNRGRILREVSIVEDKEIRGQSFMENISESL